jgi:hypothetical protein
MLYNFDPTDFWQDSEHDSDYTDDPLRPEKVSLVESALGFKLPAAYIELMKSQNGGFPVRTCHRTAKPTYWAKDHIAIVGIFAIGDAKPCSLCGHVGSEFWVAEWGYPRIGVYFADCPSQGHDMLCLDYRSCGPQGEPSVVHVAQERDYEITFVAPSFEAFIKGLQSEDAFPDTYEIED